MDITATPLPGHLHASIKISWVLKKYKNKNSHWGHVIPRDALVALGWPESNSRGHHFHLFPIFFFSEEAKQSKAEVAAPHKGVDLPQNKMLLYLSISYFLSISYHCLWNAQIFLIGKKPSLPAFGSDFALVSFFPFVPVFEQNQTVKVGTSRIWPARGRLRNSFPSLGT